MKEQLERIKAHEGLSKDSFEMVSRRSSERSMSLKGRGTINITDHWEIVIRVTFNVTAARRPRNDEDDQQLAEFDALANQPARCSWTSSRRGAARVFSSFPRDARALPSCS